MSNPAAAESEPLQPLQPLVILPAASALDYDLPEERIAMRPAEPRDASLLLVTDARAASSFPAAAAAAAAAENAPPEQGQEEGGNLLVCDSSFRSLPRFLPDGALLVLNQSRVITARLLLAKEGTGGKAEVLCLSPLEPAPDPAVALAAPSGQSVWKCLVGGKKIRAGQRLSLTTRLGAQGQGPLLKFVAEVEGREGKEGRVRFSWSSPESGPSSSSTIDDMRFGQVLEAVGRIPLPPYMHRASDAADAVDYQTVYAKAQGSVAAPTAGLHFTEALLRQLQAAPKRITPCYLTLHVGAGTFQPVAGEDVGAHAMHWERVSVPLSTLEELIAVSAAGRPIVPVGTTSVRTLESLYWWGLRLLEGGGANTTQQQQSVGDLTLAQWEPYQRGVTGRGRSFPAAAAALEALHRRARAEGLKAVGGETQLMVAPGYRFALCDGLVTNFHQPRSTLLFLVGALLGGLPAVHRVYRHALRTCGTGAGAEAGVGAGARYRFLSFGDSNLMIPPTSTLLPVRRQGLGPVAWPLGGAAGAGKGQGWVRLPPF